MGFGARARLWSSDAADDGRICWALWRFADGTSRDGGRDGLSCPGKSEATHINHGINSPIRRESLKTIAPPRTIAIDDPGNKLET